MNELPLFPEYVFLTVLCFFWGACIGSFLNVCIYRIPRDLSVVTPRSFCPHCRKPIAGYHNIPIISFLALRGKCRACGSAITARYVLVELLTAVLFLIIWLKLERPDGRQVLGLTAMSDWKLVPIYWLVVSGLILGTFVDFEHLIIPDRVTLGGIVAGILLSVVAPSLHGKEDMLSGLLWSAIGAAAGWGLLRAVAVLGKLAFRRDAMGFGDIKLLGAIGAFLGWQAILFTVLLSSLIGSIVGILLVLARMKKMQSKIPYGPYLALAAVLWIFWGPTLSSAFLNLRILPWP